MYEGLAAGLGVDLNAEVEHQTALLCATPRIGEPLDELHRRFPLAATATAGAAKAADHRTLKVMIKSAWGSDDPTKAAFPLLHGHALAEAEFWIKNKFIQELMSAHETARYRSIMNPEFCRSMPPAAPVAAELVNTQ